MRTISEIKLSEILPANLLADEKIKAMATALDEMLSDLTNDTRQALHLPRLDELSGTILDLLGWQFHCDTSSPLWLDDETKRGLIRESIATHRQFGTKAALEAVNRAFGRKIKIETWYEYSGGKPYHFRLRTKPFKSTDDLDSWLRMIHHVKSVRDRCEIILAVEKETPLYVGLGRYKHGRVRRQVAMRPFEKTAAEYAGLARWKHGQERRLMTDDYEVGRITTTLIDGERTLEISTTEVVIIYGSEREVIPLGNLFGDVLRMRFSFPNSERVLVLNNPREDLTAAEVQEVADYATEHKILLDGAGQDTQSELKRATLITTTTQVLF